VPHPRGLCEGGVFDFRTYAAAITRIDSPQQDLFVASVLPDARNRHWQSNQTPALENRQGRATRRNFHFPVGDCGGLSASSGQAEKSHIPRIPFYRALCLELSLKSRIALPRMGLGHNVKIANINDFPELEVGNPENDN
jgi:hypothetical protein